MPQPQEVQESNQDRLKNSLEKLPKSQKNGLSNSFKNQTTSQESAMQLCETAMEQLSTTYVAELENFLSQKDPQKAMHSLETLETTFKTNAEIIFELDATGDEKQFLQEMRLEQFKMMQNKLEDVARECEKKTSAENVALCLATLAAMDNILSSFGRAKNDPERERLHQIALNFK